MRLTGDPSGRWRAAVTLMAAALAAVIIAACGGSSSSGGSSSTGGSKTSSGGTSGANLSAAAALIKQAEAVPSTISQTVALPKKPGKGTVVFVNNGEPDTQVIGNGTEAAAKAAGWTFDSVSYDASSPASLQQALLNALTKHPTMVTEAGTPQSQVSASVLARYKAAGVTFIPTSTYPVVKTSVIPVTSEDIPNGITLNSDAGKILAAWFVKDSGGKGKALIPDITSFPVLHGVVNGFEQETKKLCSACSVTVLPESLSAVESGTLVSDAVSGVQRAGANYLIFENGEFGDGAASALKAAGLNDVTVAGVSPQPAQISALRDGTNGAWVNQGFQYVGWATMDLEYRLAQGAPLTSNDNTQPLQLVDDNNAKNVSEDVNIPIPASGLSQFMKLWKVN